jgi:hypothetical protein
VAVFIAKSSEKSRKVFKQYRGLPLIYQFHNLNGLNERNEKLARWAKRAAEEYQRVRPTNSNQVRRVIEFAACEFRMSQKSENSPNKR